MSSPRPKSPRTPVLPKKDDKEESFWDKIGTIGRKKRIKEGKNDISITLQTDVFVWAVNKAFPHTSS